MPCRSLRSVQYRSLPARRTGRYQLEFRSGSRATGNSCEWRVVVEYAGRQQQLLTEAVSVDVLAELIVRADSRAKCAQNRGRIKDRLAQMTAGRNRLGGDVSRTRFRVEQDCFHDSREVAAHARSVVRERGGNPLNVRGTRIAR